MIVSCNEIQANCQRAFIGLKKSSGEADKIANIILNNEIVGLPGIDIFAKALPKLLQEDNKPMNLEINNNSIAVDLNHTSIISNISILLDKILDTLQSNYDANLVIRNGYNRWLSIGALIELAKQHPHTNIQAKWNTNDGEIISIFNSNSIDEGYIYPDIFYKKHPDNTQKQARILTVALYKKITPDFSTDVATLKYSKSQLKKHHQNNIKTGITVSDSFAIIKQFTKLILVEETENSYKNAGE